MFFVTKSKYKNLEDEWFALKLDKSRLERRVAELENENMQYVSYIEKLEKKKATTKKAKDVKETTKKTSKKTTTKKNK